MASELIQCPLGSIALLWPSAGPFHPINGHSGCPSACLKRAIAEVGSTSYVSCHWITNYETRGSLIRNDAPP
jgi:hypothetical protein